MADQQWDKLMADWQSCAIAKTTSKDDLENLKALEDKTRKKARKMKWFMWADVIATVFFTTLFIYLSFQDHINIYQTVIFIGVLVIIVPMGVYSVLVRRGLWEANGNDTKAYLELAIGRAKAGIKLSKANFIAAVVAFPFIIAVITWRAYNFTGELSWPFNMYVFGVLFQMLMMGGLAVGARYYQRKFEKEQHQLQAMLDEWLADD